ncbi:MAG: hypothetical protein H0T82_02160 [Sphingomonas sp.]|nr:hypothetical protein [Sphingomonas sp.]
MSRLTILVGLVIAGASLSSCNKNSDSDALVLDARADESGRAEDKFGKGFGEAFRADPNSEPANVSANDVNPVSFTTEPEPIG